MPVFIKLTHIYLPALSLSSFFIHWCNSSTYPLILLLQIAFIILSIVSLIKSPTCYHASPLYSIPCWYFSGDSDLMPYYFYVYWETLYNSFNLSYSTIFEMLIPYFFSYSPIYLMKLVFLYIFTIFQNSLLSYAVLECFIILSLYFFCFFTSVYSYIFISKFFPWHSHLNHFESISLYSFSFSKILDCTSFRYS